MLKKMREATQDDRGFTLIELMVVVLIIAILIAIAIPTFLGLRQRAQDRSAQSDLRNALTAAKAFYTDNETYTGFTVAVAEAAEPSLDFDSNGTVANAQVEINVATGQDVVMQTISDSGQQFCITDRAQGTAPNLGVRRGIGVGATWVACNGLPDW
jgi:type IV pilus assembly protein PilA